MILASEMSGKPHVHGEIYSADRYKVPANDHWEIVGRDQEYRQRYLNMHPELNIDKKATWGVTVVLRYKSGQYATVVRLRIPDVSRDVAKERAITEALRRNPLLVMKNVKAEKIK